MKTAEGPDRTPVIAIVSGKGGTGKTTVSVNLALSASFPVALLDCDVEEPNSRLTLHPRMERTESVTRPIPEILVDRCTACGECLRICRFNAIAPTSTIPYIVPELCEGCGACLRVCASHAIVETPQEIGIIEEGSRGDIYFAQGLLHLGRTQGPTLIKALKRKAPKNRVVLLDGPPGSACPAIATLRGSDYALFVIEPTLFGLHDLECIAKAAKVLGVPGGIVINRDSNLSGVITPLAAELGLEILANLPDERRFAEAGLQGKAWVDLYPETKVVFERLWRRILHSVETSSTTNPPRSYVA